MWDKLLKMEFLKQVLLLLSEVVYWLRQYGSGECVVSEIKEEKNMVMPFAQAPTDNFL